MNDATLEQLKIIVERVVRPVRAMNVRKVRMREDLLAHVTTVFEEESEGLPDEHAVLERVKQRFGDPAELTRQLQEGVPWFDRKIGRLEHLFRYRPGEPAVRMAIRHGLLTSVGVSLVLAVPAFLSAKSRALLPFAIVFSLIVSGLSFFFILLIYGTRQALFSGTKRSWGLALLLLSVAPMATSLSVFALSWLYPNQIVLALTDPMLMHQIKFLAGFSLFAVIFGAWVPARDIRYQESWARLDIEV